MGIKIMEKRTGAAILIFLMIISFSGTLMAADFPNKPITIFVGFRAGGMADTLARLIGKDLEKQLGQPVVVDPKPGAGGGVMATKLMNAAPDGYTIGLTITNTFAFAPVFGKNTKYKSNDFTYLVPINKAQEALITNAERPYKTLKDLIGHAKAGNSISYAPIDPSSRMIGLYLERKEGIKVKMASMKGAAGAIQAVLGNHVDFGFTGGMHIPYLKAGKVRVLASAMKTRLEPPSQDVPTLMEMGYDYAIGGFFLTAGPKGIPADIRQKLSNAIKKAADGPDVMKLLENRSSPRYSLSPDETEKLIFSQEAGWKKVKARLQ